MNSLLRPVVVLAGLIFLACGGDSGTPPDPDPDPTGQTVTVRVTTSGTDLDADGYTIRLGTRSATVEVNGTATFSEVATGTYEVHLEGVALNCLPAGGTTRSVTVGGSSAQVAFTVDCFVDFADGLPTVECTDLSLEAVSGIPGDLVGAGSVPATLEAPVVAQVRAPDGSGASFAVFSDEGAGGRHLVTPLHPTASIEGGDVLLRVTDGSLACAPITFTIESLPLAEGELDSVVDELLLILDRQLAVFETTRPELAATPLDDVATPLLPLAFVQRVLDHPDNPRSLRAIAGGTAPGDYPTAVIEGLLAGTGLRDALEGGSGSASRAPAPPRATVAPTDCTPGAVGNDAQKLSQCMAAANEISATLEALVDVVREGLAATLAATIAVGGDQQVAARQALSLVLWAVAQEERDTWSRLPTTLLDPVIELDPARFDEDDDRVGTFTATVQARNLEYPYNEFDLWDLGSDVIDRLIGLGANPDDVEDGLQSYIQAQVLDLWDSTPLPLETFGPVPVDDPMWTSVAWTGEGGPIEKVEHTTYRPIATGTGRLRLRIPGEVEEVFGGRSAESEEPVTVDPIEITIEPSQVFIAPDEQVTFQINVENSAYPDDFLVAIKQGSGGSVEGSEGSYSLVYTPPPSPSFDDPDSIRVRHTATTGARASGPERLAFAVIRFGKVVIENQPVCVDTSEEFAFSAEVLGIENQEVTWSASDGTIDENGVFEAPSEPPASGVATITATSVEEPELFAEIEIPIGCSCDFGFQLGGETFTPQAGDEMFFTSSEGRLTRVTLRRDSESWSLRMLPNGLELNDRPNAPGPWPMSVQGDFGLADPADVIYSTESDAAAVLDLERYTPNQEIRGSVSGTAELVSTQSPGPIAFDWWFAIRYEPGAFTCTVGGG